MERSPNSSSTFNSYSGQLAVSVQDGNAPWTEDEYQRGQSSSVSPRGGYCSSASTPHSSGGGSYGGGNGNAYAPNISALSSTSSSVFNSTSSKPTTHTHTWTQSLIPFRSIGHFNIFFHFFILLRNFRFFFFFHSFSKFLPTISLL